MVLPFICAAVQGSATHIPPPQASVAGQVMTTFPLQSMTLCRSAEQCRPLHVLPPPGPVPASKGVRPPVPLGPDVPAPVPFVDPAPLPVGDPAPLPVAAAPPVVPEEVNWLGEALHDAATTSAAATGRVSLTIVLGANGKFMLPGSTSGPAVASLVDDLVACRTAA
jgi:hypothetical protein